MKFANFIFAFASPVATCGQFSPLIQPVKLKTITFIKSIMIKLLDFFIFLLYFQSYFKKELNSVEL